MAEFEVFLSHSSRQKVWVRSFCQILRDAGLRVFFDEDSIPPGAHVQAALGEAVENSRHVVWILSPDAIASDWVSAEALGASYLDPTAVARKVIPVILEPVGQKDIPLLLRPLNRIELSDPLRRPREFAKLLRALGVSADVLPLCPELLHKDNGQLTVASLGDVLSWGWTGADLLNELIRLDYESLTGLSSHDEGRSEQWVPVFVDHPETWRLLITAPGRIVGYWHYVTPFPDTYEELKAGTMRDEEITLDKLAMFELPGDYPMYFVSMCIKPGFRGIAATRLLLESLLGVIGSLAEQGVFFSEVTANAYTDAGVSLCRTFQMTDLRPHVSRGRVYSRRFYPFPALALIKDATGQERIYQGHFDKLAL